MADDPGTRLTGRFVGILLLEAAIIVALWLVGRIFQ
jgi:hypothetical protein